MRLNRREFALAVSAAGLGGCATTPAQESSVLRGAMAGTQTPGMSAVVIRDFRAEAELVAGVRDIETRAPVTPGQRWHLGSNGKAMTATLIARLVEAKALAWDAPLSRMLPQVAASMHPAYREATLPDLLSHHSGLPENTSDMDFFGTFFDDAAGLPEQRLRYLKSCLAEAPVLAPRTEPSYSNTGLLTAAACAEAATGRTFEALIVAEMFEPLGIHSISFEQLGGTGEPKGHLEGRVARARDANPRMFAPAGAMRLSMTDWAAFCIEHMQGARGRGKLLTAETYRLLHAPQGAVVDGAGWAMGWGVAPRPMGLKGPALTHSGSDGTWLAMVCLFPETGNGVVVDSNAADSMGGDVSTLAGMKVLAAGVAEKVGG